MKIPPPPQFLVSYTIQCAICAAVAMLWGWSALIGYLIFVVALSAVDLWYCRRFLALTTQYNDWLFERHWKQSLTGETPQPPNYINPLKVPNFAGSHIWYYYKLRWFGRV